MYRRINDLLGTSYKKDSEIDWENIVRNYRLSEDFIEEFENKLDWNYISSYQTFNEDFIRKYKDKLDLSDIATHQLLSEEFILEFKDKIDKFTLSSCQVLSENFIRNNQDIIDWDDISRCQILSGEFIDEFKDYLNWSEIAANQPFINPDHYIVLEFKDSYEEFNTFSKIYQETKERGWFVGYIENIYGFYFIYPEEDIKGYSYIKARIYWRDLIKTAITKYYDPIRLVKGL